MRMPDIVTQQNTQQGKETNMRPVVSRDEWLAARRALLVKEKPTCARATSWRQERRTLPWVKIDKAYAFDTPTGQMTLAELFSGKGQLIVHHLMFAPEWGAGCPGCSFSAEHIDGPRPHLAQKDTAIVAISRAPLDKIIAYRKRMGWTSTGCLRTAPISTTTSAWPSRGATRQGTHRLQFRDDRRRPALSDRGPAGRQRVPHQ